MKQVTARLLLAFVLLLGGLSLAQAAGHRYWRVSCGSITNCSNVELQFRTTANGSQAATGGTPIASSNYGGFPPTQSFDSNNGTFWLAITPTNWIGYDMGSGNSIDVVQIAWTSRSGYPGESPTDHEVSYSDDAATWTVAWTGTFSAWTSGSSTQISTKPAGDNGGYQQWRLLVSRASTNVSFAEVSMSETSAGANRVPGATISSDVTYGDYLPFLASDGDASTFYLGAGGSYPHWWKADFNSGTKWPITEVKITARSDGYHAEAPIQFCVQRTSDGSTWVSSWCVLTTTYTSGQTKTFQRPAYADSLTGGHRCWRIVGTANGNGDSIMSGAEVTISIATTDSVISWASMSADTTLAGDVYNLVDTDGATYWVSSNSSGWPHYVQFDFGAGFAPQVNHIEWTARTTYHGESPTVGSIQYSDDCSSYTVLRAFAKSWTSGQTQDLMLIPPESGGGHIFGANDNFRGWISREDRCEVAA